MSANWGVIIIFPIYGQFWAIQNPDSGRIVCKSYIFINSNLLPYKRWKQNWKISNKALTLLLWVKVLFLQKMLIFYKKILTSAKLRGSWYQKVYFLKLHMDLYLRTKFQVSSIIVTTFSRGRGGGLFYAPSHTPENGLLKGPPRLGLIYRAFQVSRNILHIFSFNLYYWLLLFTIDLIYRNWTNVRKAFRKWMKVF